MSREGYALFWYVVREDYAFFDVSREKDPRASSGKILRVKSRYLESLRFLGLWMVQMQKHRNSRSMRRVYGHNSVQIRVMFG